MEYNLQVFLILGAVLEGLGSTFFKLVFATCNKVNFVLLFSADSRYLAEKFSFTCVCVF